MGLAHASNSLVDGEVRGSYIIHPQAPVGLGAMCSGGHQVVNFFYLGGVSFSIYKTFQNMSRSLYH